MSLTSENLKLVNANLVLLYTIAEENTTQNGKLAPLINVQAHVGIRACRREMGNNEFCWSGHNDESYRASYPMHTCTHVAYKYPRSYHIININI